MKRTLLLLLALLTLGGSGAWATDVVIANCPNFTNGTASSILPSTYGSFSGQTFTTNASSGLAGVTITAATGCKIGEQYVNVNHYGDCLKLVTSAASTNYQITLSAPTGYVITGYTIGGSANTNNAKHTLTSKDGSVSVVVSAPPYNDPVGAKVFAVSGLKEQTTYFTINTASSASTLFIPTFTIYVYPEDQVRDVTYDVYFNGNSKATATATNSIVGSTLSLPSSAANSFCTYKYYSDSSLETEITTVPATGKVYTEAIWNGPFTISSTFNTATWYYLKIRTSKYVVYGDAAPYTLTTTKEDGKKGQWAFMGNPYDGIQVINRSAGSGYYLQATTTQPSMTTTATNWVIGYNGGNFTLYDSSVGYINDAGGEGLLKYWNNSLGATDDGSTFRVEAAPSDEEALANLLANYEIAVANLDKPGFPTTAAYTTFRSTIEGFSSLEAWDEGFDAALAAVKASVIYPSGTYYIKNRNTGCYAFITDDGELVPRIKIDNTVSHANNNYLWSVTSDKSAGTCSIVSSLYSSVPFAKGDNVYSNITSSNRTTITALSTELFSSNNGTSGAFYLGGAHNNNTYTGNGEGTGNSHIVDWSYQSSSGSQWIFEPVDLSGSTAYTVTVEGLEEGGEDAVTLSDGTIVNLGTGTAYLSETPTTSNITQSAVSGYTILDGSIVVDTESHTITVTYSPSYEVLIANYYDSAKQTNVQRAGKTGYPKTSATTYTTLMSLLSTFTAGHEYTASDYANIQSYYNAYVAETDIVVPPSGFYRINGYSGNYITSNTAGSNAAMNGTASVDNILYYDGDGYLIFYKDGLGLAHTHTVATVGTTLNAYTFSRGAQFGKMYLKSNGKTVYSNNDGEYCYDNTSNGTKLDRNGSAVTSGSYQTDWSVEAVTTLPVTITAAGYATLYAPVALTIPEGVRAYTATDEGTYLSLTEIEDGVIPANTGVILAGDADTYNFTITTGGTATSELTGTVAAISRPTDSYILATGSAGVGFYKDGASTIPGFKAYLAYGSGPVKAFRFADADGVDAIVNGNLSNGEWYDLSGRRVSKPGRGLYIVNGKKVLVK